jgi:hypothetical protein
MILIPHSQQPIVEELPATTEMRAWMELVTNVVKNYSQEFRSIAANYTTNGSQFLRVTGACTITLNPSPNNGERVNIQPDGGFTVTIVGTINGATPTNITTAYEMVALTYITELGEWVR